MINIKSTRLHLGSTFFLYWIEFLLIIFFLKKTLVIFFKNLADKKLLVADFYHMYILYIYIYMDT